MCGRWRSWCCCAGSRLSSQVQIRRHCTKKRCVHFPGYKMRNRSFIKTMVPSLEMKIGQKVRQKREMATKPKSLDQRVRQQKQQRWGMSISKAPPLSQEGKWEAECCVRVSTVSYSDWPAQWLNCTRACKWHQLSQERWGWVVQPAWASWPHQAARSRETLWSGGN